MKLFLYRSRSREQQTTRTREFEDQLKFSTARDDLLLPENHTLQQEITNITLLNELLAGDNNKKDAAITHLKLKFEIVKNDFLKSESKKSWNKDKWVDYTILNAYFSAMSGL